MPPNENNRPFHITVAATPNNQAGVSITGELQLLKAALLYADKVTYCSASSSFLIKLLQFGQLSGQEMVTAFAQGMNNPELNRALSTIANLMSKKRRSGQELIALKRLQAYIRQFEVDARKYFETMLIDAGLNHLSTAFDTGLVDIQVLQATDTKDLAQEYFDRVSEAVLSGETYPLFDDFTGGLIDSAVREGIIAPSDTSMNRAKQIALSSDLLRRLPLFDDAPVDQVIDIRRELENPLVRFRAAIIKFSADVQSASWDKEFPKDAERVFREHVEPAVLDIEDAVKSNRLLFRLIPDLVDKSVVPASASALALLLAQASQLPSIVAGGLGLAAGASTTALRSVHEWNKENQTIQSNQLYFYYQAGKMLRQ